MSRLLAVLCCCLAALVACTVAEKRYFVGGQFVGADGFEAERFAQYGWVPPAQTNEFEPFPWAGRRWNRYVPGNGAISDLAPVRDGVFAVGSNMAAYFDGKKWCNVRQPPDGSAYLSYCSDDSNCFVLGGFSSVLNSDVLTSGFVHYRWDAVSEEWLIEDDVQWSYSSGSGTLPSGQLRKLIGAGGTAALPAYFFVLYHNGGSYTLYRGSAFDGGWVEYIDSAEDYDIFGGEVYVTTGSSGVLAQHHGKFAVSDAIPSTADWTPFMSGLNATLFDSVDKIDVVSADLVYFTGLYNAPEGPFGSNYRVFRWRDGLGAPTVLGRPFGPASYGNPFDWAILVDPADEDSAIVWGEFLETNYLEDPGDPAASRPLNFAKGFARWNREERLWEEPFGGGIGYGDGTYDLASAIAYNSRTGSFYFAGDFYNVFDVQANGIAYFDEDVAQGDRRLVNGVSSAWAGLLHRLPWSRQDGGDYGAVWAIAPSPRGDRVFFGGDFDFVGPKGSLGSVASAVVGKGAREVSRVGGGLYNLNFDYSSAENLEKKPYLYAGAVYGLAIDKKNLWLYAAGSFERGLANQCLRNVARIKLSPNCDKVAQDADWEDVDGGCNGPVSAAVMYEGNLVVAGSFSRCGGLQVNNVAMLVKGRWTALNTGLDAQATTLTVFRDSLVVGGDFESAGGLMVSGVAAWNDGRWYPLRSSCEGLCDWPLETLETPEQPYYIRALTATKDHIYATGLYLVEADFPIFPVRKSTVADAKSNAFFKRTTKEPKSEQAQSAQEAEKNFNPGPFDLILAAIFRWVPSTNAGLDGYWHKLGAVTLGEEGRGVRIPSYLGPAISLAHSGDVLVAPNSDALYAFHDQKANFVTHGEEMFDGSAVCAAVDDS